MAYLRTVFLVQGMGILYVRMLMDNIISHWIFKWHRVLPDHDLSNFVEAEIFVLGIIMLAVGVYREVKERKHMA